MEVEGKKQVRCRSADSGFLKHCGDVHALSGSPENDARATKTSCVAAGFRPLILSGRSGPRASKGHSRFALQTRFLFLSSTSTPATEIRHPSHFINKPHSTHPNRINRIQIRRNGTQGRSEGMSLGSASSACFGTGSDLEIFRPHPPQARLLPVRLRPRRRRLARRPPPHLARRRSAPRPERRPTAPTSTRVRAPHPDRSI